MVLVPAFQQVFLTSPVHLLNHNVSAKQPDSGMAWNKGQQPIPPSILRRKASIRTASRNHWPWLFSMGQSALLPAACQLRDHLSLLSWQVHCMHSQTKGHKENMDFLVRKSSKWTLEWQREEI